jgi:phosphate-selective porin O/P
MPQFPKLCTQCAVTLVVCAAPAIAQDPDPAWDSGTPLPPEIASDAEVPAGTADYDHGFRIISADGRNELIIEGLIQVVGRADGARDPSSDFVLKRIRPEFSGRIDEHYLFKFEPNFTEHEVELEEAWAGMELWEGAAVLRVGRMKAPFGLEEVRSRRNIDFPVFSIINQFSPAEDHGVFPYGLTQSGRLEWNTAVYNGTGAGDTGANKDVAGRLMVHPFAGADSVWQGLQLASPERSAAKTTRSRAHTCGTLRGSTSPSTRPARASTARARAWDSRPRGSTAPGWHKPRAST